MSSQRTLETYHKMATPTPTMSNAIYRHLVTECFCVSKIFGFWFSFPPRVPMTILKTYFNSSLRRRLAIGYSISTKCGFSKSSYTFTRIWHRVYNFCSILPIYRIEIIAEFLCLRTLCFSTIWTFDNLRKNEKFSSQIKFPKTSLFKTFRQLKVGRRLKYRYPVNRIIWILRVSYNHMIAQNIKERATVSSSKLHE